MIKRTVTSFATATLVAVVFCAANPASAVVFESFEGGGVGDGWANSSLPAPVSSTNDNDPTHKDAFLHVASGGGESTRYTAADDGGNDISLGWRMDYFHGSSSDKVGMYFQISDVNHSNVIELIISSGSIWLEGSGGKERVHTLNSSSDWHSVELSPDYNTNTVSVILDGVQSAGINPRASMGGLTGFNMLFYLAGNAGIDNMRNVPEPASAALLCLSGTALMLRRRRR